MKPRQFMLVDPAGLRLPGARQGGADPAKLQRQIARFGKLLDGMPAIEVKRGTDGELVIFDGVTRSTRAAKLLPGTPILVEITGDLTAAVGRLPTVGEKL